MTSGVVEDHLDRLGASAVDECVRLRGFGERDAMRDELREGQLAEELRRQREPAFAVPPRRERRIDPPDLRADDADAAAVEAAAEVERHRLLAVPRADDDRAFGRDRIDRLLQGAGTATRVDGD